MKRKAMKRCAVMAMTAVLMTSALAMGEETEQGRQTALDAFYSLLAEEEDPGAIVPKDTYLDGIMGGKYSGELADPSQAAVIAGDLEPLSGITNRDLAAYASSHGLKMAQVRNAYFLALANVLKAEIMVHPASEEKYQSIQVILSLFLNREENESDQEERAKIRARMSPEQSLKIADQYDLPVSFVEFVIMDENWDDADWKNDDEWLTRAGQTGWTGQAFDDILIGSRDSGDSTLIADLQEVLISLGYLKGKADGVFGPRTQAALLEFQLANGFPANGIYGSRIYDKLHDTDVVARWDYDDDFWDSEDYDPDTPDNDTPDHDTPDHDTPDHDTPDYNTPDYDMPDYNTPDYDTPDYNTPDYDTPDYNTPDYNTPDYDTPDYDSPDYDTDD